MENDVVRALLDMQEKHRSMQQHLDQMQVLLNGLLAQARSLDTRVSALEAIRQPTERKDSGD